VEIQEGRMYHIFNQGNNRRKIFFERKNYLFFLKKIRVHVLPYADVLAWCLMPNHFHLMVLVRGLESEGFTPSETFTSRPKNQNLNHSIGVMLRSYTRAINKQEGITGALFRQATKAQCLDCPEGISPSFLNTSSGTQIYLSNPEKEYPQVCFDYIHQNPVKAKLVKSITDWEYSSAQDYFGERNGKLINRKVAEEYVNPSQNPEPSIR